jgi:hypothetical protein|tara:strand:- start:11 stop:964 length:954 start_codon:yes stop_codon:yes gene_type:complete
MKTKRNRYRHNKDSKKHNKTQGKKYGKPYGKNKDTNNSPMTTVYSQMNCSPNPNKSDFSCYTNDALFKMKNYWNARHQRDTISTNEPKKIWNELRDKMGNSCDRESCWLRSKFMEGKVDSELLNYTFAPKSPDDWKRNPNEWLSSLDIESVMKQYEKFYKCFEFLGPSPIDYDHHKLYGECVWEELCNLNLSKMIKRNKNKLGIIFNTDPHYKNGEHWISMFVNIKKKFIVYFDSNGNEPPKQVSKLIDNIRDQGRQIGIDFKVHINEKEHQQTESECGMYSLYFIIQMLKDRDVTYFLKNKIPDKEVFELRKKYFN